MPPIQIMYYGQEHRRLTATLFVVAVCRVASERLLKLTVCVMKP